MPVRSHRLVSEAEKKAELSRVTEERQKACFRLFTAPRDPGLFHEASEPLE